MLLRDKNWLIIQFFTYCGCITNHSVWVEQIKKFYQRRKSQRTVTVSLIGNKIPLYGGGVDLMSKEGKPVAPVSLTLDFKVRARAYVLGRLVQPKFYKRVQCNVVMDPKKMNVPISLKKFCTYIWLKITKYEGRCNKETNKMTKIYRQVLASG